MPGVVWVLLAGVPLVAGCWLLVRYLTIRQRTRERVFALACIDEPLPAAEEEPGFLRRWLALAGFRSPEAPALFIGLTALGLAIGLLIGLAILLTGLVGRAVEVFGRIPAGLGNLLLPLAYATPWMVALVLGALPWAVVRGVRQRRECAVEQDMPVYLDLLATLSEAGLGFDVALERILATQPLDRAVAQEFRTYQAEVLSGRPRIRCLRRLARRLDVITFSIFISALVQAEQTGMGIADVLRRQAEDLRERRREQALAVAMALPVKLLFPLVICFLPGIFVVTLGPAFYQVFQLADNIVRTRSLP
jgi:pilus assembly protein TadC